MTPNNVKKWSSFRTYVHKHIRESGRTSPAKCEIRWLEERSSENFTGVPSPCFEHHLLVTKSNVGSVLKADQNKPRFFPSKGPAFQRGCSSILGGEFYEVLRFHKIKKIGCMSNNLSRFISLFASFLNFTEWVYFYFKHCRLSQQFKCSPIFSWFFFQVSYRYWQHLQPPPLKNSPVLFLLRFELTQF